MSVALLLDLFRAVSLWVGMGVCLFLLIVFLRRLWSAALRRPMHDVSGRWILVTGCDSGFGRSVVSSMVERGARVIAFCLTPEGAQQAMDAGAALASDFDLTDEEALAKATSEAIVACDGELWGLVHNAGVVLPGFVDYLPLSFYRKVMEVNFFVPVSLTQRLLSCLRAAKGRVVLVSSVDGLVSLPGNAPYDASKFALEAYADALRTELSFWDIEVSVVNPATMRTPLAMTFFEGHRRAWSAMNECEPGGSWQEAYPKEWLDAYVSTNAKQLERIAQDPSHAADDIVHALCAKRPRLRYLSGIFAKTFFYALWVMPENWSHHIKKAMIQPAPKISSSADTSVS